MDLDSSGPLVTEIDHLSKNYQGVQPLKDLNLAVRQHSIFAFLGIEWRGHNDDYQAAVRPGLAHERLGTYL